jgi:bacillaene synthase trans-acting acyltransferase
MDKSVVFMYAGQGSQYYEMGKELFSDNFIFRKWMTALDEIYIDITGNSVISMLYESGHKKGDIFNNILYTHPAIFMLEYALTQTLIERGIIPDLLLGYSLGEYTSCAVSGALSYEDTMQCLIKQAQLLEASSINGGMTVILDNCKLSSEILNVNNSLQIGAVNFNSHFIVSGEINSLIEIEKYLKGKGIIYQRLPVPFPFHSSFVEPIQSEYTEFLKSKTFKSPALKALSCSIGNEVNSFDNNFLWNVVRNPIDFRNIIKYMNNANNYFLIDLGPSGVLANFIKYGTDYDNQNEVFTVITPFGKEIVNMNKLLLSVGK